MDRVVLKEKAKEKIEGKKWYLWKPIVMWNVTILIFAFLVGMVIGIPVTIADLDEATTNDIISVVGTCTGCIFGILETVFMYGYTKYCLHLARGKEEEWTMPYKYVKGHIVPTLILSILVGLVIGLASILLIIPGIIFAIGLSFYQEVYVDNEELTAREVMRKAWDITNGHKAELFVLGLSFIGWMLLAGLTLGILMIWLFPYMNMTFIYAYEELSGGAKKAVAKEEKKQEKKEEPKKEIKEPVKKETKKTAKKETKKASKKTNKKKTA